MKTILVTGSTRGLGRATAERLAVAGHRVLLGARDDAAGARAVAEIRVAAPGAPLEALPLDLASFASIRALGAALAERGERLDAVLHNAGVMQQSSTRRETRDGVEETLGVNALAPFLLGCVLRPLLAPAARLVWVSSRLHLPGSRGAPVDFRFDDPELRVGYDPERAYKNSKLAMLWLAFEIARRAPPAVLTSNGVCPGFVPTTAAASSTSRLQRLLLRHVLPRFSFARTVDEASSSFAFMLLDPSLDGVTGRFYGERRPIDASPDARDPEKAARFLRWAEERTGARWQHDGVVPPP